jgi:hypothetical protein
VFAFAATVSAPAAAQSPVVEEAAVTSAQPTFVETEGEVAATCYRAVEFVYGVVREQPEAVGFDPETADGQAVIGALEETGAYWEQVFLGMFTNIADAEPAYDEAGARLDSLLESYDGDMQRWLALNDLGDQCTAIMDERLHASNE